MKIIAERKYGLQLLTDNESQTVLTYKWTSTVLVVAVINHRSKRPQSRTEWACYIESTSDPYSTEEIKRIMRKGTKISSKIALEIFPDVHELMKEEKFMFYRY